MLRSALAVCVAMALVGVAHAEVLTPRKPTRLALLCFSKGEQISGMNKICYYDCAGSASAITVKSYELCPLSINQ